MVSSPTGSATTPSGPERTCVGCRLKAPRVSLLRIVAVDGAATPDPGRMLGGRGANVHRTAACLALAVRRKSLPRALRVPDLDVAPLVEWIAAHEE